MQFPKIDLHVFMNGTSFYLQTRISSKCSTIGFFPIKTSLGKNSQNSFSIHFDFIIPFPNKRLFIKEYQWDGEAKTKCVSQMGLCYGVLI